MQLNSFQEALNVEMWGFWYPCMYHVNVIRFVDFIRVIWKCFIRLSVTEEFSLGLNIKYFV